MSSVIPFEQASQLPAEALNKFADSADDLIASSGGFPILSIRGSKWRLKAGGDEQPIIDSTTGDPIPSLEFVIIKPAKGLSKNYYEADFNEGDAEAPDCFSVDGITPDKSLKSPQCATCAACPQNVWGSKISPNGNETKACSDSKIMAVTFATDLRNEAMGGPMMLRVPAASLKDMTSYGRQLKGKGFVTQQVVTRIGFDLEASYPKLTFKAVRPLAAEDVNVVSELFDTDSVAAITEGVATTAPAAPRPAPVAAQPTVDVNFETAAVPQAAPPVVTAPVVPPSMFEEEVAVAEVAVAPTPAPKKAAPKKAAPKPEPVAEVVLPAATDDGGSSDAMDALLGELDGLVD